MSTKLSPIWFRRDARHHSKTAKKINIILFALTTFNEGIKLLEFFVYNTNCIIL